jgi:DNA modification methylase
MSNLTDSVDMVLTSPPYNMTYRKGGFGDSGRYDVYKDWMEESEYINWMVELFNSFDLILKKNKVVAFNFGYSIENPGLPYKLVAEIESKTHFMVADTIIWKKSNGLPFPAQKQRLSRTWEFVFIFCRKDEADTFDTYKGVSSVSQKTGQTYYNVVYNMIESKNNDEVCPLNQATYSSDLCMQILNIYATKDYVVYDPFMGTGTTAVACKQLGMNYVGSEISAQQCEWAETRLSKTADILSTEVAKERLWNE